MSWGVLDRDGACADLSRQLQMVGVHRDLAGSKGGPGDPHRPQDSGARPWGSPLPAAAAGVLVAHVAGPSSSSSPSASVCSSAAGPESRAPARQAASPGGGSRSGASPRSYRDTPSPPLQYLPPMNNPTTSDAATAPSIDASGEATCALARHAPALPWSGARPGTQLAAQKQVKCPNPGCSLPRTSPRQRTWAGTLLI